MDQRIHTTIEGVLAKVRPSLGGADVRLRNISRGIVTVEYYRPLVNPSACHVNRTEVTKDIIIEVLEDQLRKVVPGLRKVTLQAKE